MKNLKNKILGFTIKVLNPFKLASIKEICNLDKKLGVTYEILKDKDLNTEIVFTFPDNNLRNIPEASIRSFVPLMLKGRRCKENTDYFLEVNYEKD